MKEKKYPLSQVAAIKDKRYDQAVVVLKEKKKALEDEQKKLQDLQEAHRKEQERQESKLQELRDTMDEGSISRKIEERKSSLSIS